ncbi:MAG: M56 family metallopeptidase [Actinobacteria bacterium]|nr:M56 family metallopeptidase [Actinomycetota bacterium]
MKVNFKSYHNSRLSVSLLIALGLVGLLFTTIAGMSTYVSLDQVREFCTHAQNTIGKILMSNPILAILLLVGLSAFLWAVGRNLFIVYLTARHIKATQWESILIDGYKVNILDTNIPLAFVWGIFKPQIYIASSIINKLEDSEFKALVIHEIAHIKHRDNILLNLGIFVRDFMFFLPLSHYLFEEFCMEKEKAADDYAISVTKDPLVLARALVKVAKMHFVETPMILSYAPAFSDRASIHERITRLIDKKEVRKPLKGFVIAVLATLIMVIIFTATALAVSERSSSQCVKVGNRFNCNDSNYLGHF